MIATAIFPGTNGHKFKGKIVDILRHVDISNSVGDDGFPCDGEISETEFGYECTLCGEEFPYEPGTEKPDTGE